MDYSILRCGAVADGVTNCAAAIQQAPCWSASVFPLSTSLRTLSAPKSLSR